MTNQESLNALIKTNNDLAETNKEAVSINKISIDILQSEREKNAALLRICGQTHSYLNNKRDKIGKKKRYVESSTVRSQVYPCSPLKSEINKPQRWGFLVSKYFWIHLDTFWIYP